MNTNFLKNYMDLDEFLAVKHLCSGLSRTESDYSEDEMDQDLVSFIDEQDIPSECGLPAQLNINNTPLTSPSTVSISDTDEGIGGSVCSSENPASSSSCESSISLNENDRTTRVRKKKSTNVCTEKERAAPRKRRRKTSGEKGTAAEIAKLEKQKAGSIMSRNARKTVDEAAKDDKYWERRRKNNQAAKRSRDLKRQKEMSVKERAESLEEENRQLREEVQQLKDYLKSLGDKKDKKC